MNSEKKTELEHGVRTELSDDALEGVSGGLTIEDLLGNSFSTIPKFRTGQFVRPTIMLTAGEVNHFNCKSCHGRLSVGRIGGKINPCGGEYAYQVLCPQCGGWLYATGQGNYEFGSPDFPGVPEKFLQPV